MNTYYLCAAILAFLLGLAHSLLGELLIFRTLRLRNAQLKWLSPRHLAAAPDYDACSDPVGFSDSLRPLLVGRHKGQAPCLDRLPPDGWPHRSWRHGLKVGPLTTR